MKITAKILTGQGIKVESCRGFCGWSGGSIIKEASMDAFEVFLKDALCSNRATLTVHGWLDGYDIMPNYTGGDEFVLAVYIDSEKVWERKV